MQKPLSRALVKHAEKGYMIRPTLFRYIDALNQIRHRCALAWQRASPLLATSFSPTPFCARVLLFALLYV